MNTSVSYYAPKNKTYSKTQSLNMHVAIAAGVQILRYLGFWRRVFTAFELDMDDNLQKSLQYRNDKKGDKTIQEQSKVGKIKKSSGKYVTYTTAQQQARDSHIAGL